MNRKPLHAGLTALALLLAMPSALAAPTLDTPTLATLPPAGATTLGSVRGYLQLKGAVAYIPPGLAADQPAPLLVLLHGAGQRGAMMCRRFQAEADRRGIILLAPNSAGPTWDMTLNIMADGVGTASTRVGFSPKPRFDNDPPRIDAALTQIFATAPIDRARIGLLGFSDGASYAIPLGLANPELFSALMILSPGMFYPPRRVVPHERVFVAHGTRDQILSYDFTRRAIVPGLKARRLDVTFKSFKGDHEMSEEVVAAAIDFFLAGTPARNEDSDARRGASK